ncbi:UDP-N-acetylglucosamine transporter UGNT1-like isoform X3 [Quercus lobata]|uniref:UDP-N-acetylglucosamine transporter UGNT1-like isoform X3 n=1 Tax=Quercus lobata TaxID=97700 RepID=UPI001243D7B0|nr:UDP-N-acetylglucosamine transporter UGNT1-like isoform X3 [Quercus lobata]
MDSTLKFKVTDAQSHRDKELVGVGVGALAMASEKNQKLPVSDPLLSDETHKKASAITTKGAQAAISYMLTAVLLVLFNKAALSSYNFPCVNVITLFQLVSMESVRGISVPMYTTLRRTTVAFTMIVEYVLTGKKHSPSIVACVGIILLGAFVAGARDLSFDAYAYAVVFVANICTAVYLASIAHIGKSSGLNTFGLMWCNGIICAPILLFWTSIRGDLQVTLNFPYLFFPGFQVVILLSCILAFLINYCVFLNTTLNSALTQTICGNLKDLLTIGLGWVLFGGLPFDFLNVLGQSLGFLGSCLYAYYKLQGK